MEQNTTPERDAFHAERNTTFSPKLDEYGISLLRLIASFLLCTPLLRSPVIEKNAPFLWI
jgi:hypothetical protein